MKFSLLIALLLTALTLSQADAKVPAIGRGESIIFNPDFIPANLKSSFHIMNNKCIRCHSMERIVVSVQTGRGQVTGKPYDKLNIKSHGIRLLRHSNADLSRQEISEVVALLSFLIYENKE